MADEERPEVVRALQAQLLESLEREGDQGLWELAWFLDVSPGQSADVIAEKVRLSREATLPLLQAGEIEVWRMDDWPPQFYERLTDEEFMALQDDDLLWSSPDKATALLELRLRSSS